jgi:hypothetical protein
MATTKYFSGDKEVTYYGPMKNAAFAAAFPGVKGKWFDSFARIVGKADGVVLPVTRVITYKSNPSLHKCDARCMNATGGNCECSCGGKNHGAGNH